MSNLLNQSSERCDVFKVLSNNQLIKICSIHSNEYLKYYIENELYITPNVLLLDEDGNQKVDAILGFSINIHTNALTRILIWKQIEIKNEDDIKEEDKKVEIDL
jgi:hypothetical protein